MKVLLINGSPHANGSTFRALSEVSQSLNNEGIETEIITVGNKNIFGCKGCGACVGKGECIQKDDIVNEIIKKIEMADGLVIGSPVYYASLNGTLKCLLDRVFYAKKSFENKPACAVVCARRAGTTATIDVINKYFAISNMPIISSSYWNMAFGVNSQEVEFDEEGMQTMRRLGKNMAWLIKCIEQGKNAGIIPPEQEKKLKTNFYKKTF